VPVYKRPVFRQSSPKLDLILNINVLESSPSASPFPHLLHKPLRVISSNTRDFYFLQVLATSSLLVQVVLSRPVEALTWVLFCWVVFGWYEVYSGECFFCTFLWIATPKDPVCCTFLAPTFFIFLVGWVLGGVADSH